MSDSQKNSIDAWQQEVPTGRKHGGKRNGKKKNRGCAVLLGILAVFVIAAIVMIVSVTGEISGRGANPDDVVEVTVEQGTGPATVARLLKDNGVIGSETLFRLYLRQTGTAPGLQYGTFKLYHGESYADIVEALSQYAAAETVRVTFPDGNTAIDFANRMEEAGLCTAEEFLETANNGDFSQYKFWNEMGQNENRFMKCEGYLFPETYDFYKDSTVYDYVDTFYSHFDSQITDEMYARMEELGMTLDETIILASFVQEEAGNEESAHVSAVFHNRLAEGSPFPALESNACSYVQNDEDNNYLWNWVAPYYGGWDQIPANIYNAYDTYAIRGLPAGAISNPGHDAILAALYPEEPNPEEGTHYFFVTDKTGKYYYGRTVAEHGANCNKAWSVNAKL